MFLGHFAAKSIAPRVALGWLFLAAQFIDLLWPTLLLLGLERVSIIPGITTVTPCCSNTVPFPTACSPSRSGPSCSAAAISCCGGNGSGRWCWVRW